MEVTIKPELPPELLQDQNLSVTLCTIHDDIGTVRGPLSLFANGQIAQFTQLCTSSPPKYLSSNIVEVPRNVCCCIKFLYHNLLEEKEEILRMIDGQRMNLLPGREENLTLDFIDDNLLLLCDNWTSYKRDYNHIKKTQQIDLNLVNLDISPQNDNDLFLNSDPIFVQCVQAVPVQIIEIEPLYDSIKKMTQLVNAPIIDLVGKRSTYCSICDTNIAGSYIDLLTHRRKKHLANDALSDFTQVTHDKYVINGSHQPKQKKVKKTKENSKKGKIGRPRKGMKIN